MDPNQTIADILTELADPEPDRGIVTDGLEALVRWLATGGFYPRPIPTAAKLDDNARREWRDALNQTYAVEHGA